jgi:hypothetical protein
MTPLLWMSSASVGSWLLVTRLAPEPLNPELLMGMAGPLASAIATWVVTARIQRTAPERVMAVMMMGFVVKMMLFGVYVVVMVRVVELRAVPFILAFTGYFIGLYGIEAFFLKRLFVDGMRSASSA